MKQFRNIINQRRIKQYEKDKFNAFCGNGLLNNDNAEAFSSNLDSMDFSENRGFLGFGVFQIKYYPDAKLFREISASSHNFAVGFDHS